MYRYFPKRLLRSFGPSCPDRIFCMLTFTFTSPNEDNWRGHTQTTLIKCTDLENHRYDELMRTVWLSELSSFNIMQAQYQSKVYPKFWLVMNISKKKLFSWGYYKFTFSVLLHPVFQINLRKVKISRFLNVIRFSKNSSTLLVVKTSWTEQKQVDKDSLTSEREYPAEVHLNEDYLH